MNPHLVGARIHLINARTALEDLGRLWPTERRRAHENARMIEAERSIKAALKSLEQAGEHT